MRWTFWVCYFIISFGVDFILDTYEIVVPLSGQRFIREFWADERNFFPGILGPLAVEFCLYYVVDNLSRNFK